VKLDSEVDVPAGDILEAGACSAMCLLARCPEPCACRCGGAFHGMLANAGIPCDEDHATVIAAAIKSPGIPAGDDSVERALEAASRIARARTNDHATVRLQMLAALEGYEELPTGAELERLAELAHVSRATAYRATKSSPSAGSAA
jgi:hypothetical protein